MNIIFNLALITTLAISVALLTGVAVSACHAQPVPSKRTATITIEIKDGGVRVTDEAKEVKQSKPDQETNSFTLE